MSYFEMESVVFRGELVAANGEVDFTLTAWAIDAIDSVNLAGSSVSYSVYGKSTNINAVNGLSMLNLVFIVDKPTIVGITVYSNRYDHFRLNNQVQSNRGLNGKNPTLPVTRIILLGVGSYTLSIYAGSTGLATVYGAVKYYRETGG